MTEGYGKRPEGAALIFHPGTGTRSLRYCSSIEARDNTGVIKAAFPILEQEKNAGEVLWDLAEGIFNPAAVEAAQ